MNIQTISIIFFCFYSTGYTLIHLIHLYGFIVHKCRRTCSEKSSMQINFPSSNWIWPKVMHKHTATETNTQRKHVIFSWLCRFFGVVLLFHSLNIVSCWFYFSLGSTNHRPFFALSRLQSYARGTHKLSIVAHLPLGTIISVTR